MEFKQLNIIDTQTGNAINYDALGFDSLVLNYNGGDEKIVDIVPSELQFSLVDKTATDAMFKFLTDEPKRYLVQVETKINTQTYIIWEGYLVADEYSEQIVGINREVSFNAIDGLAYLKNIFFENYKQTLTFYELIQTILKETGFDYPILFFPAIKNVSVDWKDIKIDLRHYEDTSMYDILKELLKDTLTSIFKYRQNWYIEGLNIKQFTKRSGNYIATDGTVSDITYEESVSENLQFLPDPEININYPPKQIKVIESERKYNLKKLNEFSLDYLLYNLVYKYKSYKWWGKNVELYNRLKPKSNYYLTGESAYDNNKYAFTNVFVKKGVKIKIKASFKKENSSDDVVAGEMRYLLKLSDEIVDANFNISGFVYNDVDAMTYDGKDITFEYEFIANRTGFFQIYIYSIIDIEFTSFDIDITESEFGKEVSVDIFDRGNMQEFTLDIYPDKRLLGKSFILDVPDAYDQSVTVEHQVYYIKTIEGKNALSVDMQTAIDIEAFPDNITWGGNPVKIDKIIYNWLGGEAIYLLTSDMSIDTSHPLQVVTHSPYNAAIDRSEYEQWLDNFYGIGNNAYKDVFLSILTKLQKEQHSRVSVVFNQILEYTNFFKFDYNGNRLYRASNMSVNLLRAETDVVAHECFYDVDTLTNHPPYIYAPSPVIIEESADTATISAEIVDVDGTVTGIIWEKLVGSGGDISSPNAAVTDLTNVTDDYYEYGIVVTDDSGNESKAIVEVMKKKSINFSVTELDYDEVSDCVYQWENKLNVENIIENDVLLADVVLKTEGNGSMWITKNGQVVAIATLNSIQNVKLSIEKTDDIKIFMKHLDCCDDYGNCHGWDITFTLKINRVRIVNGKKRIDSFNIPFEYTKTHN